MTRRDAERPTELGDLDTLRRRAEQAYARWRACDAQRPRDGATDVECTRLKNEYDLADHEYLRARKPSVPTS
jgi:hypothetical protein